MKTVATCPSNSANLFIKRFLRESVEGFPKRFVMEDLGLDTVEEAVDLDSMQEAQDLMEVGQVLVDLEVSETVSLMRNCYLRNKSK